MSAEYGVLGLCSVDRPVPPVHLEISLVKCRHAIDYIYCILLCIISLIKLKYQ